MTRQRGFAAVALDAALLTPASADPHHGGFVFGLAALGAAAVVGVVTIVTAAVLVSAPFYAPGPASYPPAPLVVAEARHFPALAAIVVREGGRAEVVGQIALMLEREARAGSLAIDRPEFAAEQFLQLVVSLPSHSALGHGTPMTKVELDAWADCVNLFLNGSASGSRASRDRKRGRPSRTGRSAHDMIHASTRRPDNDVRGLVRCVREVIEALDPGQAAGTP